jgi:hypothetical protein
MIDRAKIQRELIKLKGGERLLRLAEPQSGLSLEQKLNPDRPVADQKNNFFPLPKLRSTRAELSPA